MSWEKLQPKVPPEIQEVSTKVVEGLNAVKTALEAAQAIISITQSLVQTQAGVAVTLTNQAIQLVVDAVQGLLNSFLDDTGAYILLVPLPKKGLVAVASQPDTPDEPGSNYVGFPDSALLSALPEAAAARLRSSPSFSAIFDTGNLSLGGNAYLVKTISSSIYDSGDRNRPKFTGDNYWAYGLAVAGAPDLTSILTALTFLDRFFAPPRSANSLSASRGIADIVAARVQARPSGRGRLPVIEWDRVPSSVALTSYDQSTVVARKYAVIRSTDFRTKTATTILDLFPTAEISEGMTGPGGAKVLKIGNYDGLLNRYIDTDTLEEGTTYYYFIAFQARVMNSLNGPDSGNSRPRSPGQDPDEAERPYTDLPFGLISSSAEWRMPTSGAQLSSTRLSQAPDWYRSKSVAGIVPGLERFLDIVNELLESFRQTALGVTGRAREYLNQISASVTQLERRIEDIQQAVAKFTAIFANVNVGVYATTGTGRGSASSFISSVVQAIDDPSDENRPPFDVGDEYVIAAVVVVVSPDAAVVDTAKTLLDLILGGGGVTSPALAGIESIQTELATIEQSLIDQLTGGGTATSGASLTFDESMQPRPLGQADANC